MGSRFRRNRRDAAGAQELNQSSRKFTGVFLILGSLFVHGVIFTAIYINWLAALPGWALTIYFALAGAAWFVPAAYIITWMSKPDAD